MESRYYCLHKIPHVDYTRVKRNESNISESNPRCLHQTSRIAHIRPRASLISDLAHRSYQTSRIAHIRPRASLISDLVHRSYQNPQCLHQTSRIAHIRTHNFGQVGVLEVEREKLDETLYYCYIIAILLLHYCYIIAILLLYYCLHKITHLDYTRETPHLSRRNPI
jgi:hypothetical protein